LYIKRQPGRTAQRWRTAYQALLEILQYMSLTRGKNMHGAQPIGYLAGNAEFFGKAINERAKSHALYTTAEFDSPRFNS
jgi:hypothetical protein